MALIPQEHVVSLTLECKLEVPEELFFAMPNIEHFRFHYPMLTDGFLQPNPDGPHANEKLLPSLRTLRLEYLSEDGDKGWEPLKTYLSHQTSGGQTILLQISSDRFFMPPKFVEEIQGMIGKFACRVYRRACVGGNVINDW